MFKSSAWKKLGSLRGPAKQRATDGAIFLKAAKMQRLRLVRMMLDGGVDVNWQNEEGYSALMCVITSHTCDNEDPQASSKYTMVDFLLRVGSDPNLRDRNGKTALIHACQLNAEAEIIQLLIVCNADPSTRDFTARSALDYAAAQQNETVVKLLSQAVTVAKTVMFTTKETLCKDQFQMQTYLQVPKLDSISKTGARSPLGSPKPLRRQNTICCTGDEEFRRLWDEEIGSGLMAARGSGTTGSGSASASGSMKGGYSLLTRRNTAAAALPSFALHSVAEREATFELDTAFTEPDSTTSQPSTLAPQESLYEWEQQASSKAKARARAAWLDKYQKVLKARTSVSGGAILEVIKDETNDSKMLECAMATRLRSASLQERESAELRPPQQVLISRSKSEDRQSQRQAIQQALIASRAITSSANALSDPEQRCRPSVLASPRRHGSILCDTDLDDIHPTIVENSVLTTVYTPTTATTTIATPTLDPEAKVASSNGESDTVAGPAVATRKKDKNNWLSPAASPIRRASTDVRPKHPNAQFLHSRSNTFHGSKTTPFKEELIETI